MLYRKENFECIKKEHLEDGKYYSGFCRNANIARWSEKDNCFYHWRQKFTNVFVESIKHPDDEQVFDVFHAVMPIHNIVGIKEVNFPEEQ